MPSSTATKGAVETLSNCPCCDSTRLKRLAAPEYWIAPDHFADVKNEVGLTKCEACGMVFTNPRPSSALLNLFYDRPGYDSHAVGHDPSEERHTTARFEILERECTKGTYLDYGCGTGNMLRAAKARGWPRVIGVELSDTPRNRLLEEGFEVHRDLSTLDQLKGSIDAVSMIQVLEHLQDLDSALDAVRALLRPQGVFAVEVPNAGSLRARIADWPLRKLLRHPVQRYQAFPIHLYYFEATQLAMLLRRRLFRTSDVRTMGFGIDELWPRPSAESLPAGPAERVSPIAPVGTAKNIVKTAFSQLRLGEHLFTVCRKAS